MSKKTLFVLLFCVLFFFPLYAQNVVNVSLSKQEMQNGIVLFNQRKYTAAIQAFESALSYEPLNHAAKYRLGLAYLYAGYTQSAMRLWEELVRLGVADYQVIEQLNNLYFFTSLDEGYKFEDPYIFREYYDGFTQGGHDVFRTSFIKYDAQRDIKYVSSVGKKQVIALDSANNIIAKYGRQALFFNRLQMPMGLATHSNLLFVADYKKNSIFVFDRNRFGVLVTNFGHDTDVLSNQLSGPMGIVISEDQYLYVVDNGNARIQKYQLDGTFVYHFGSSYLYRPTDIVVKDQLVYITDITPEKTGRVVVFDESGNFITTIGSEFLKEPRGLFLDDNDLYITDTSGYIYLYNIQNKISSTFLNNNKLLYPFSLMKDKDSVLWTTDFNSQKLAIFTPLQGVYGNINLEISQILLDHYPTVFALVRARNKDKSPVTGLSKDEIQITEFDTPVRDIMINSGQKFQDQLKLTFIIDRSLEGQKYTPQLEYYLKTFLSNTSGDDLMDIVLVDDQNYRSGEQATSITRAWNFITNHQSQSVFPQSWDEPIYDSITQLLNNFRKRAIVVFTSGEVYQDSFGSYGVDIIQTYADQNSIPIYVVNFSDKNVDSWGKIAQNTHGRYFQANKNADQILNLFNIIKQAPPLEYLVEYKSDYRNVPDVWIDVGLKINRLGLSGATVSGYYMPKVFRSTINLWENFFPSNVTNE